MSKCVLLFAVIWPVAKETRLKDGRAKFVDTIYVMIVNVCMRRYHHECETSVAACAAALFYIHLDLFYFFVRLPLACLLRF